MIQQKGLGSDFMKIGKDTEQDTYGERITVGMIVIQVTSWEEPQEKEVLLLFTANPSG